MPKLKYLQGTILVLKWATLYPIDKENSFFKKSLYFLWTVHFISTLTITGAQCLIKLLTDPFDLIEESILIMNTAIYLNSYMNFFVFSYYSKLMVTLVTNINDNFLDVTDNGVEDISMEYFGKLTDKFLVYYTLSTMASTFYIGGATLLSGDKFEEIEVMIIVIVFRALPLSAWFPYDYTKSPLYEISCAWQLLSQIYLGLVYGCTDVIFPTTTLFVGYQFKLLASNLKNSFYYALWKSGVHKDTVREFKMKLETDDLLDLARRYRDIFEIIESSKFHQINVNYFKKNIQYHRLLLTYCDDLSKIMGLLILTKLFAAFFNLTMIIFGVITSGDYSKTMSLSSYVFFGTAEIFAYTYGGQILTQSADILWSLYEAPWYLCNLHYKKIFLVVQMKVSKNIYTKAANCFPLTAPMCISVLRGVFSYATLLRQLGSPEK